GMYSYWSSFHIVCDCVHINTILRMRDTDWFYDSHHTLHLLLVLYKTIQHKYKGNNIKRKGSLGFPAIARMDWTFTHAIMISTKRIPLPTDVIDSPLILLSVVLSAVLKTPGRSPYVTRDKIRYLSLTNKQVQLNC
uniref:Uncharacterized protein n=1 Tax=Amphimedon queenslandica TaxID=400682 RepID=A0A1X7T5T0_AMPQE